MLEGAYSRAEQQEQWMVLFWAHGRGGQRFVSSCVGNSCLHVPLLISCCNVCHGYELLATQLGSTTTSTQFANILH
jgi:hypothetical protein